MADYTIYDEKRLSPLWSQINEKTLAIKKKAGDRVAFVVKKYTIGSDNPVIGSRYECFGTVAQSNDSSGGCSVAWDNMGHNSYQHYDLMLIKDNDPNKLFKLRKKRN